MQFRKFAGAILNYGAGSFVPQLVGFLLLPLYTRFLTPVDYGIADLCSSVGLVFVVVAKLGLPGAVARFYFDFENEEELGTYVRTIALFLFVETSLLTAIAMAATAALGPRVFPEVPFFPFFFLAFLNAPFSTLTDIQRRLLQSKERAGETAILNIASAAFAIILNVLLVAVFQWGAMGLLLSTVLTSFVFSIVALVRMRRYFRGGFELKCVPASLRYGLPLVPNHVSGWLLQMGSRVVLGSLGTTSQLGLYAVASKFVQPFTVLEAAFYTAFIPIYFRLRREADTAQALDRLREIARVSIVVFVCLFVGIAGIMPGLLRLATPPEYHEAGALVWIVAAGVLGSVYYHVVGSEMFYAKKTSLVFPITLSGGVFALATSAVLVPILGGMGAALGSTFGLAVTAIVGIKLNARLYRVGLPYRRLLLGTGLGVCVGALMSSLSVAGPTRQIAAGAAVTLVFSSGFLYIEGLRWTTVKGLFRSEPKVASALPKSDG